MANIVDKTMKIPSLKASMLFVLTQILLRILCFGATLAAAWIMFTNKQTAVVYGIQTDARYSYSPAFKFFAIANLIACGFSVVSLFLAFILGKKAVGSTYYFYMFLHDLVMTLLLMAGCAAATAIGYVGKYGNSHTGWMSICGYFAKFCYRATAATTLSYIAIILYLALTIISAKKSSQFVV